MGCNSSNVLEVDIRDDTIERQRLAAKNKRRRALYAQKKYEKNCVLSVKAIDVKSKINAKLGPSHGLCSDFSLSNTYALGNTLVYSVSKTIGDNPSYNPGFVDGSASQVTVDCSLINDLVDGENQTGRDDQTDKERVNLRNKRRRELYAEKKKNKQVILGETHRRKGFT